MWGQKDIEQQRWPWPFKLYVLLTSCNNNSTRYLLTSLLVCLKVEYRGSNNDRYLQKTKTRSWHHLANSLEAPGSNQVSTRVVPKIPIGWCRPRKWSVHRCWSRCLFCTSAILSSETDLPLLREQTGERYHRVVSLVSQRWTTQWIIARRQSDLLQSKSLKKSLCLFSSQNFEAGWAEIKFYRITLSLAKARVS